MKAEICKDKYNDTITYSTSKGGIENTTVEVITEDWDDFAEKLSKPIIGNKNGSYFTRSKILGKRNDKNATPYKAQMIIIDADSGLDGKTCPAPEFVAEILQDTDWQYILYTSHSYNPPEINKFRILIKTDREINKDESDSIYKYLIHNKLYSDGVKIAENSESKTWSQGFYYPRVDKSRSDKFFFSSSGIKDLPVDEILNEISTLKLTESESNNKDIQILSDEQKNIIRDDAPPCIKFFATDTRLPATGNRNFNTISMVLCSYGIETDIGIDETANISNTFISGYKYSNSLKNEKQRLKNFTSRFISMKRAKYTFSCGCVKVLEAPAKAFDCKTCLLKKSEDQKKIDDAKKILDEAIKNQKTDAGALYTDEALKAYNTLYELSKPHSAVYRDLISDVKNLKITTFEKRAKETKNINMFGASGEPKNVIERFNKQFAGIMVGGQFRILEEKRDIHGRPDINIMTIRDFHDRFTNSLMPDPAEPSKIIQTSKYWTQSPSRRDYMGGLDFRPQGCPAHIYNMFKGFSVQEKKGKWSMLKNHVYEVLAGGNKRHGDYILAWVAHMLQKPHEKNETCLVFLSGQGTGKNTFIDAVGKILGRHYQVVTNINHVTGKFNAHFKDTLLVFINEALWGGDKQGAGQTKGLITDHKIRIEMKGKDTFEIDNYINVIFASNNDYAISAQKGDRRHFVFKVSEHRIGDREYFKALHHEINNGGVEAMLYDLLRRDISSIDLRYIDRTEGLLDQIIRGMGSIDKYWLHRLNDGYLLSALYDDDGFILRKPLEWDEPVVSALQFNDYKRYCREHNVRHPEVDGVFGKYFTDLYKDIKKRRKLIESDEYSEKVRAWHREFPPLEECRDIFAKNILQMNTDDVFDN